MVDAQLRSHLLRPRAGGVDDVLAGELAGRGVQAVAPVGEQLVAVELRVLQQPRALRRGQLGEQLAVEVAVDEPVAGAVQAGADVIAADVGEALGDPLGVEHHRVLDPELALHRDAALEARGVLARCGRCAGSRCA